MKQRAIPEAKPGRPRKNPLKASTSVERRVDFDQKIASNGGARYTVILPDAEHVAAVIFLADTFSLKRGPATARAVLDLALHLGMSRKKRSQSRSRSSAASPSRAHAPTRTKDPK